MIHPLYAIKNKFYAIQQYFENTKNIFGYFKNLCYLCVELHKIIQKAISNSFLKEYPIYTRKYCLKRQCHSARPDKTGFYFQK